MNNNFELNDEQHVTFDKESSKQMDIFRIALSYAADKEISVNKAIKILNKISLNTIEEEEN